MLELVVMLPGLFGVVCDGRIRNRRDLLSRHIQPLPVATAPRSLGLGVFFLPREPVSATRACRAAIAHLRLAVGGGGAVTETPLTWNL